MLVRNYCVRDVLAGNFMNPVAMSNDEVAIRSLRIAANDPNAFKENKNDIQLWYVFTIDTETGIVSENQPYCLGNLVDFVKKEVE